MGRLTEIIAAINSEAPLDNEHFSRLDVTNPTVREEIMEARRQLRKNKRTQKTLFEM